MEEILIKLLVGICLSVASFIGGRAIIGFFHAHRWHPEKRLANWLVRTKRQIASAVGAQKPPHIENAPGLHWVRLKDCWKAEWRASEKGPYLPRRARLWSGNNPNPTEMEFAASRCRLLQEEMENWRDRMAESRERSKKLDPGMVRIFDPKIHGLAALERESS